MDKLRPGDPERVGKYLLLGRLGTGGMGEVFLGRSPGGRLVAVKVIRRELATDPEFRTRFAREVVAARMVSGLFTAMVVDADTESSLPWLVTNYVNGPSLAQAVAEHGALPIASVLALAAGLAEGLSAVHAAGVVHRDLKPSNVLLAHDGPRLIDFGISYASDFTALTSVGTVIGSPGFMSPEQAEGATVGPASDVFSLGAVLAFAATGEGPFGGGTPGAQLYRVVHGIPHLDLVPGQVRPLIGRCLAKNPVQRPTAEQFLAELTSAHPAAADLSDWLPPSILAQDSSAGVSTGPAAGWPPEGAASSGLPVAAMGNSAMGASAMGDAPSPMTPVIGADTVDARWPEAPGRPAVKRRRRWALVSGIVAAVVILGAVAGVLAAAPWKKAVPPPVLRPAGLTADSSGISMLAFRWSGPATGPVPDRYEILRDGHRIGYVAGSVTFYQDAGLVPASAYKYQVIAIRGGKLSPVSAILTLDTVTPPVSDARLAGTWTASYKVTAMSNFTLNGAKAWSDDWTFNPACTTGPCGATLDGQFKGISFSSSLTRAGAVYTGTATVNGFSECTSTKFQEHATLTIRIQVHGAGVQRSAWAATSWGGTVTMEVPPQSVCNSSRIDMTVKSS